MRTISHGTGCQSTLAGAAELRLGTHLLCNAIALADTPLVSLSPATFAQEWTH